MTITSFPDHPFLMRQAIEAGASRSQVRAALADGRLRTVLRDVYAPSLLELTPLDRARAAALVTSPYAVVCDRTASWIHGVDVWRPFELDVTPVLETCVLRGHEPTERQEVRCLTRDLAPRDLVTIGGVRVTTPLRTALDLGCRLPRRQAFAAMNALARAHGLGRADILGELPRYRRRRGCIQLRELTHMLEPRVESQRESWVLIEIHDFGLPTPTPQWWIEIDGVPTYRLDFAYPRARVTVEYDGLEHHSSPADRERDEERRAWLRAHGWTVIVLTAQSFVYDAVPAWIPELRRALRMAA